MVSFMNLVSQTRGAQLAFRSLCAFQVQQHSYRKSRAEHRLRRPQAK